MLRKFLPVFLTISISVSLVQADSGNVSCSEGRKNFPFLKKWADKLENFKMPIESGDGENSLFHVVGATITEKKVSDKWRNASALLELKPNQKDTKLETVWLGEIPNGMLTANKSLVKPGPGTSKVIANGSHSQNSTAALDLEPSLRTYGADVLKDPSIQGGWLQVWKNLFAPVELDLLGRCTKDSCKIKFNDPELAQVARVSDQYRINEFRHVFQKRLSQYQESGEIFSYEGTSGPVHWDEIAINPVLPTQLATHFSKPTDRKSFGFESLDAEPGRHKPVLSVFGRQCEKRGSGAGEYTVCADIVVYNNHYFDYWARLVYFFPWCGGGELALIYETLDIDQIKGSSIIRVLLGGQMRKSLETLLNTRLKHLVVLGS